MAQQFFRASLHLDGSSIAPTYNVSSAPVDAPSKQGSITSIQSRELPRSFYGDHKEMDSTLNTRLSKRKKVVNSQSGHRFVSQKKWKFTDGQPWPPPKLSSKAQNASKAMRQNKVESISPDRDSVRQKPCEYADVETCRVQPYAPDHQQRNLQTPSLPQKGQSYSEEFQLIPQNLHPGSNNSTQLVSLAATEITSASMNSLTLQKNRDLAANVSTKIAQPPTSSCRESVQLAMDETRPSRSRKALSLENDSERIAALIVEKRKENESSMFRERMLQRQLEHKSQTGMGVCPRKDHNGDSRSPTHTTGVRQCSQNIVSDDGAIPTTKADEPKLLDLSTNDGQSCSFVHEKRSDRRGKSSETNLGCSKSTSQLQSTLARGSITYSSPVNPSPIRDEREILFGKGSPSKDTNSSLRSQAHRRNHVDSAIALQPRGSVPIEAENAEIASQLIAFSNQIVLKESTRNVPPRTLSGSQYPRSQYFDNRTPTLPKSAQSQDLQRTDSTPSANDRPSPEALTASMPSPTSVLSSQSPTSMTPQRFTAFNVSAYPYGSGPGNLSFAQGRSMSTEHLASDASSCRTSNRQAWNTREGLIESSDAHRQNITLNPHRMTRGSNETPGQSLELQQRPQPRSLPSSSSNVLSDKQKTRTSTSSNRKGTTPKQRVNMFSNIKGTPFPVHEVIRQIEMT